MSTPVVVSAVVSLVPIFVAKTPGDSCVGISFTKANKNALKF